jgi:signal transduction histidine kinase
MGMRKHLPQAIFIYLVAIVAPALVLLSLGLQSVRRQHQAMRALAESNRLLSAEKLDAAVEGRTRQLAETCLREKALSGKPHPVVQHYFTVQQGVVVSPRLHTPPPFVIANLPPVFREAETLEMSQGRLELALEGYSKAYDLSPSKEGKALALSRTARCLKKLNRNPAAEQTWRTIFENYPDVYDPSHRPYALTARFELNQPDAAYEDLIANRWELSAEQFDYYLSRLNRPPPGSHRFVLARELDEHFRHAGPLRENELYKFKLPHFTLYYRLEAAPGRIDGIAVNQGWLSGSLIPTVRRELGLPDAAPLESNRGLWIYGGATAFVLTLLVLGVVFVIRDVTREARLNQLRTDFVSGVSHELKTPLTLIRLYAETLLRKDYPLEERRGFYEIITRESERLSHLIQKVLSFSRIERGEKEYTLQQGDLGPTIARTVEVYSQYLEKAGFQVETSLSQHLPEVCFDQDAVAQAVVNLIDNAAKYSGSSRFVGVRLRQKNSSVIFEVEDHGAGIPTDQREKIFERFYRAPNGNAKGGYGLGLFLVRHIMDAHHGRVEVDSVSGSGSSFRLVFPIAS